MKKILLLAGALFIGASAAMAAPGDTTTVLSHDATHLTWYQAYDTPVVFPDGSTSYRNITMEFELGKYACPGYNPSNAGEGAGQTGWCGDWDYDVHLLVMTPGGDTFELGEMITPYANHNMPATPLSWTHKYMFDVTDYYSVLKNGATMRIFYAGYSGGFTGTVRFHFVEGARARNVFGIQPLYRGNFAYGLASNPIETNVAETPLVVPVGTVAASFKTIITGHGGISGSNCSEFCQKWLRFKVNGSIVNQRDIWRDNCGSNWLAPQSGTWIYPRANWCPGNLVDLMIQDIDPAVLTATSPTADIDFEPFTASGAGASYKMSTNIFYYGTTTNVNDANVMEILAPTSDVEYRRTNPVCGMVPQIRVKNMGSAPISSIEVSQSITGSTPVTSTVTVSIPSMKEAVVSLPTLPGTEVTGEQTYSVEITKVNNVTDDYTLDNSLTSKFTAAPQYTLGKVVIQTKNSGNIGGGVNNVNWQLRDVNTGVLVASRTINTTATIAYDTLALPTGCYKLEVVTPGFGLSFFSSIPSPGYVRLFNGGTGTRIPMADNDLGSTGLEGNFGNGFTHYFSVQNPTAINQPIASNFVLQAYPNPANSELNIKLGGTLKGDITYTLINALGKKVYTNISKDSEVKIATQGFAAGMYLVEVQAEGFRKTEKVMIKR